MSVEQKIESGEYKFEIIPHATTLPSSRKNNVETIVEAYESMNEVKQVKPEPSTDQTIVLKKKTTVQSRKPQYKAVLNENGVIVMRCSSRLQQLTEEGFVYLVQKLIVERVSYRKLASALGIGHSRLRRFKDSIEKLIAMKCLNELTFADFTDLSSYTRAGET